MPIRGASPRRESGIPLQRCFVMSIIYQMMPTTTRRGEAPLGQCDRVIASIPSAAIEIMTQPSIQQETGPQASRTDRAARRRRPARAATAAAAIVALRRRHDARGVLRGSCAADVRRARPVGAEGATGAPRSRLLGRRRRRRRRLRSAALGGGQAVQDARNAADLRVDANGDHYSGDHRYQVLLLASV